MDDKSDTRAPHRPQLSLGTTVEELSTRECWHLAADETGVGRMGFISPDGAPDIVPLNFIITQRQIFCRTSPGTKTAALTHNPQVAFEIDGIAGAKQWSVVFRGMAWRMDDETEIYDSGVTAMTPQLPLPTTLFLRIAPLHVVGRRFTVRASDDS